MSIATILEHFAQALELTTAERERADYQQRALRETLRARVPGVSRDFLAGSYARHTAIRPLHDIDLVIVLERAARPAVLPPPSSILREVRSALQGAYPSHELPVLQNRSVHIEFTGTGIGYDLVPAIADVGRPDVLRIPDRGRDDWIPTSPERHIEWGRRANEAAGSKLKPLVKFLKAWRRAHRVGIRSFHLEVLCGRLLTSPPGDYARGLSFLFQALPDAVRRTCEDPADAGGPALDQGFAPDDRQRVCNALADARSSFAAAVSAANGGSASVARTTLDRLFGSSVGSH